MRRPVACGRRYEGGGGGGARGARRSEKGRAGGGVQCKVQWGGVGATGRRGAAVVRPPHWLRVGWMRWDLCWIDLSCSRGQVLAGGLIRSGVGWKRATLAASSAGATLKQHARCDEKGTTVCVWGVGGVKRQRWWGALWAGGMAAAVREPAREEGTAKPRVPRRQGRGWGWGMGSPARA